MVLASLFALVGHVLAMFIENAIHLWMVSITIGFSYGVVFGVYPSIVSESFGLKHFSQNWGWVAASPVFSSYVLNVIFGKLYDANAVPRGDHDPGHVCLKGVRCYSSAFAITSVVSVSGIALALYMISFPKGPPSSVGRKNRPLRPRQ
jgi:MFS family permease